MKKKSPLDLIGNTPLLYLDKLSKEAGADIYGKCEFLNPSGSVKDRAALGMIEEAEESGKLTKGMTIVEATSGNTGIGLAFIAAVKGYKVILTMPESMSLERRKILKGLGVELVLTSAHLGMKGALDTCQKLVDTREDVFVPSQFDNPANPNFHKKTTAEEIWADTEGKIDIFVAGVGTGGTISGVSEVIKSKKASFKAIAVEPEDSPVLSGGEPGPHMIQGIGAGFVPKNLNRDVVDEVCCVSNMAALDMARRLVKEQGLMVGISSGANVYAAQQLAKQYPGTTIVTILCDFSERYLSTLLFQD
ncbi:MAG: cysteine synthase A [bacterium]